MIDWAKDLEELSDKLKFNMNVYDVLVMERSVEQLRRLERQNQIMGEFIGELTKMVIEWAERSAGTEGKEGGTD